ncbi:SusC/RagA family TonB-linked outer membrane protein [Hymenobacter actinosclerus]|uniref:TonB-linked outer membrane protein, SusC/RagA family n=1 Tax=Hymenobacter actinosclerus TaxID=82805 RepID=A0A1I0I907_9BACT|nr:SusC/RagA family TonB-linked outer membrane protein [Hymenobacter actinosclerus]SET92252.1 TonB-linked outer membrane protein, SusC/RagA family [Hymenobacter actinosclerus]
MVRLLPLSFLLPLTLPALAQQADTVRLPDVCIEKSLILDQTIYKSCWPLGQTPLLDNQCPEHYIPSLLPLQEQLRQVAGVQATPYSGAPGTGEVVRIRGAASIDSHVQPLYVVDGVPMFQYRFSSFMPQEANSPYSSDFNFEAGSNPLLSIPVADVEQVQVLKGAYETGQYGFLGQNGVILITTKRGKAGQAPRVHYAGYGGVQQARHRYDLLGARELAEVHNEANRNNGYDPEYSPAQLAAFGRGTDWQSELLRTAAIQEHHLSTDGSFGTADTQFGTRYYLGADYLRQTGIVLNSSLQRYALRFNLDQQLGRRAHFSAGLSYGETQERRLAQTGLQQAMPVALYYLPMIPVYAPNGDYATDYDNPNPVQRARQNYATPRNRRLLARGQMQFELLTGLKLDLRVSLERDALQASEYEGPRVVSSTAPTDGQEIRQREATYRQRLLNPALRFDRTFGGKHAVQASIEAAHWQRDESRSVLTFGRGGLPPFNVPPGRNDFGYSSYETSQQYQAITARVGYTYAGRYAVAASWQRNATPLLGGSEASQYLPAAQLSWHAGEEAWLKDRGIISRLDARVGWGVTSNRGNFAGSHGFNQPLGGNLGSYFLFLDELTTQYDAGLDVGLWQNRLTLSAALYRRETDIRLGIGSPDESELLNRGLETTVAASWQAGKLSGTSSLAASFNHNRYQRPADAPIQIFVPGPNFVLISDQPVSTFYGSRYLGPDASGDPQFASQNREALGSGLPRQLLSLSQTARYGRLSLQFQVDGMFGYQVYDPNLALLDVPTGYFNASTRVRNRWTPTNTNTQVPRAGASYTRFGQVSNYTLQSGNHLRLSALTLAADVWKHGARNAAVFVSGTNLLVISKYRGFDPNVSGGEADPRQAGLDRGYYPTARTVAVGVRATL